MVDSSTLPSPLIQIHDNNVCGSPIAAEVVDVANTSNAAGMGVAAVNADPATSSTTTKTIIRTQSTSFDLFVVNEGSLTQTYSLTADSDGIGGSFPTGLTVSFTDTGGTPITVTPTLNPGDTYQYRAVITTNLPIAFGNYPLYFHVTGTASAADVKQDTVAIAPGVDVANSATATGLGDYAVNADPSSSVTTTLSAQATWTVSYPLYLINESGINQAFSLSADTNGTGGAFPAGWTVVFKDTSGTTITSTPVVTAGNTYQYSAEVTTPPATADDTYPIYFHADGVTVAAASDEKQDALTIDSGLSNNVVDLASSNTATGFGGVPGVDADPDTVNSNTVYVEPGGNTAVFNLYVTNESSTDSRNFDIEAFANNSADALPADWLPVVFKNTGGTTITQTPTLTPGETFAFTAEVTAPAAVTELLQPIYFRVSPTSGSGANSWNSNFVQAAVQVGQLADLAITKSVDVPTPSEGDIIVYTLTLTNNGPGNAAQLEVTDVLPTGVTYVSDDSGGDYDDATGVWTPNPLNSGASAVLNITVTVDAGTAGITITNTATVTNSNRIDPDATNDISNVDINVVAPSITILKSSMVVSDPVNGSTNPKAIPGATVLYSVQVTNQGLGTPDVDSMIITDPIPANTTLIGPVTFTDGTPSSNLSFTFTDLDNGTDDVEFSTDGGTTWTADGSDPAITHMRMRPKGTFAASDGTNHPSFILRFQVTVQ